MRKDVRKPRRSILYVPGSNEKALKKSSTLDVDALIYDLEDSVAPNAKESARDSLIKIINSGVNKDKEQVVRINSLDSDTGKDDLKILDHCIPDAILIPKVNSADDVIECEKLINNEGIKIWVMMETALSIVNAYEIAKVSKALKCFVMGTNDLSAELGIEEDLKRTALQTSFEKCMMASKAYKISILDGVFNDIKDSEGFEQECVYSHGLGFDGKTLIHPSQINICNKIFTPTPDQLEKARSIVSAFEKARKEDPEVGVIIFEGSQIEELHVAHARRILEAEKLIMEVSKDNESIPIEVKSGSKYKIGNFFEDFSMGQKISHATPRTITLGDCSLYTALYGSRYALHSSNEFAKQLSLKESPVDDFLLFNIAFGKTVPDISLNAIANLGYAECKFLKPAYPGDTITSHSEVIGLKENSNGDNGVVYVHSTGLNQKNEAVIDYKRWVMVRKKNKSLPKIESVIPKLNSEVTKEEVIAISKDYQFEMKNYDFTAAGSDLVFEDYKIDEKINHIDGITVEEAEHMMATKLYQNNAKVHFNHFVEKGGRFGKRIVYGGHVISLTRSISFNGLSNAFKIIAINGGTHASPCFAGKTVFAWSKIIEKVDVSDTLGALRIRTNGLGDAQPYQFQHQDQNGKFNSDVLLSLDYWALVPKKI
ncbi:MAG: aldolase/citrate lyase family protein [Candidatus Pelagibacterales bacterium]